MSRETAVNFVRSGRKCSVFANVDWPENTNLYHLLWFCDEYTTRGSFVPSFLYFANAGADPFIHWFLVVRLVAAVCPRQQLCMTDRVA